VLALGEDRQLVQIFSKPCGLFGEMHKTVLDHCGLGVHAHDFVGLRLIAGDRMETLGDQFLDQLGAGGLVLDRHHTRA
jgi:hypothetical protein